MVIICPTILAGSQQEYSAQMDKVKGFAKRIQIDLTDGRFAKTKTIDIDTVWWPKDMIADLHLMYEHPDECLEKLIELKPNMVIIHAEAEVPHGDFALEMQRAGIKTGLAVLPKTSVSSIEHIIKSFDHLLIFSGDLGHFGGKADLSLLDKAMEAKACRSELEIGWDGGVDDQNAKQLAEGGVDVLSAGGFIQNAQDPEAAYSKLLHEVEPSK